MVDYWAGLKMSEKVTQKERKPYLWLSLLVNLGLLFYFKYYGFFIGNLNELFNQFNLLINFQYMNILLPVGISFYTFQTLSYSIDIYRGNAKAEKHLGYFALYVTYFPQLVAGPIERSTRLLPQLRNKPKVSKEDIKYGVNKILLGFFKKLVIADNLAPFVNETYGNLEGSNGTQVYLATLFFGFQIFCDFSGYTDIAMGSARLMGVKLMENFKRPLWESNLSDFWAKWHISLTTWIRDYIYVPLRKAGKDVRGNTLYAAFSTIFIMVIIGFWHGASWTFIVFGLGHGVLLILQRLTKPLPIFVWMRSNKFTFWWYKMYNFQTTVFLGILFRAPTMADARLVFSKIFTEFTLDVGAILSAYKFQILISCFLSLILLATILFDKKLKFKYNWLYVTGMIAIILLLGADNSSQFIYFQF
ncbi:MAG: D-alanyl-lipoteichoic acid acyltransferase DltB (MBOAT superfamily) [Cryomorphaceae bacterium]|jgi:D-alanyl-lipoteichoic acid acyltransferase DltB (MBOAT superfamily)